MSNKTDYKSMSLLETLLYVALFGLIFISIFEFFLFTAEKNQVATERIEIERTVLFIEEHLQDTINRGESIDEVNSIFDQDSGKVRIIINGGYGEYRIVSGKLVYDEDATVNDLIPSRFTVSRLYVEKVLDSAAEVTGVRLTIELNSKKISINKTTFSTLLILTRF